MTYHSVAGLFFPASPKDQTSMVTSLLESAKQVDIPGPIKGLIVPHAGWIYSGIVAATAYRTLTKYADRPLSVVLVGPSHQEFFSGTVKGIADHSVEVQLPFLHYIAPQAKITPLVYGNLSYQELTRKIKKNLDERTTVIASSDLSHYHPYAEAVSIDRKTNNCILNLDLSRMETLGDACGKTGIMALLTLAKSRHWKIKLLAYRNSGDSTGDKKAVVGYAAFALYV